MFKVIQYLIKFPHKIFLILKKQSKIYVTYKNKENLFKYSKLQNANYDKMY